MDNIMDNTIDKTITHVEIDKIKENLKELKIELFELLNHNNINPETFFEKILNIQNQILSSNEIKNAQLEKEFSEVIKTINFLNSKQDTQIKEVKNKIINILRVYLELKEKLISITEYNLKKTDILYEMIFELKNGIEKNIIGNNNEAGENGENGKNGKNGKNGNKKLSKTYVILSYIKEFLISFSKHPAVLRVVTILGVMFGLVFILAFTKHYIPSVYSDVKDVTKTTVTTVNKMLK